MQSGASRPRRGAIVNGIRILVVDDDELLLRILEEVLPEVEGLAVDGVATASTPEDAFEKLRSMQPGGLVVLSDFNLKAEINGLQLLARVQKLRPDAVRILFSGYSADQIGDVSGDGAAHAFLDKPIRIREMLPAFAAIVQRELALPEKARAGTR
jgi:DNA-binding NtrC family response regulator